MRACTLRNSERTPQALPTTRKAPRAARAPARQPGLPWQDSAAHMRSWQQQHRSSKPSRAAGPIVVLRGAAPKSTHRSRLPFAAIVDRASRGAPKARVLATALQQAREGGPR